MRKALKADVVVVPHHGSRTSSSQDFVGAVSPWLVLNSSAYLNRYGFPAEQVQQRWQQNGSRFYDTAIHGAIELELDQEGQLRRLTPYRDQQPKYWYWDRRQ